MDNPTLSRKKTNVVRKKSRRKRKLLTMIGLVFLLSIIGIVGVLAYSYQLVDDAFGHIEVKSRDTAHINYKHKSEFMNDLADTNKPFAVAIIGVDTREGSGGTLNADVMMVALVDPIKYEVRLMSIPRDTKVKIPGYEGYRKANAAFALGDNQRRQQERKNEVVDISGPALVQDTLSHLLEIPIHYYITVDFKGFVDIVDAVNGIEVNVKKSMRYDSEADGTHIHINTGTQTLDGKTALGYVRHRLDNRGVKYQSSDFERNERQQEVIKAVLKKLISLEGVSNFPSVIKAISHNVTTSFTREEMEELAWELKSFSPAKIKTIETGAYWDSKQSFTIIPEEKLLEIQQEVKEFLKGTP